MHGLDVVRKTRINWLYRYWNLNITGAGRHRTRGGSNDDNGTGT